jgi:predicted dehydrogenase
MNMAIAVLGLGSIGLRHAGNLLMLGERVVGFDPDQARRDKLASIGGEVESDRSAALMAAEAVVVASPSQYHGADLADAISAGCHVFAEKPLCHRVDGISDLLEEAASKDLVVFAAHNLRFHPAVERAKQAIDAGAIGRILWARLLLSSYLPSWRPEADYREGYAADPRTGGIIFDDVHEIDLANYLLGPAQVAAAVARRTGELDIAAEDCADIILLHEGEWNSTIHMDFASQNRQRLVEVSGNEGLIRLDLAARRFIQISTNGDIIHDDALGGRIDDDYIAEITSFLTCFRNRKKPRCDGYEALRMIEQVLMARQLAGLPKA